MISLGILQHLKGRTDQFLSEVHSGSLDELQAVLINHDTHSTLLEHSESRASVRHDREYLIELVGGAMGGHNKTARAFTCRLPSFRGQ